MVMKMPKRALKFGLFGLLLVLVTCAFSVYALSVTQKRELLRTTSFKLEGGEQRFTAIHLSAPVTWFEVEFNVSSGTIKFSSWDARSFEDGQGYFIKSVNETTVEKIQIWFFEVSNETVGFGPDLGDGNQIWYLHFYNEDSYEKEVHIEVTKVWERPNYQDLL